MDQGTSLKLCRGCGKTKPVDAFATKPYGDGKRTRASRCKDCMREWAANYRSEQASRVNENARLGYGRDPSRKKASKAAYYQRNHAAIRTARRAKYEIIAATRPEVFRAARARRKQRLRVRMDALDRALSAAYRIAIRDDTCFYCGLCSAEMHDDHFYPLAKGGTDHWWNLVRACGPCNMHKHTGCGTWFLLRSGGAVGEHRRASAVA
jgi:5-methylcytosine-specific restriction endonuclease McrA